MNVFHTVKTLKIKFLVENCSFMSTAKMYFLLGSIKSFLISIAQGRDEGTRNKWTDEWMRKYPVVCILFHCCIIF